MCILYQFICLFLSAFVGFCLFVSLLDCRHICIFLLSIFCVLFCFYLFVFYFVCLFINFFFCLHAVTNPGPASQIQNTFRHPSKANIDFFGQYFFFIFCLLYICLFIFLLSRTAQLLTLSLTDRLTHPLRPSETCGL